MCQVNFACNTLVKLPVFSIWWQVLRSFYSVTIVLCCMEKIQISQSEIDFLRLCHYLFSSFLYIFSSVHHLQSNKFILYPCVRSFYCPWLGLYRPTFDMPGLFAFGLTVVWLPTEVNSLASLVLTTVAWVQSLGSACDMVCGTITNRWIFSYYMNFCFP